MPQNIIWIGSFPKSGNTWVRAFLGNYFMPTGKPLSINELSSITTSDVRSDWYDKAAGKPFFGKNFDDWVSLRPKVLRLISRSTSGHQFVKTHSKIDCISDTELIMPEVTAAAIYIIRNPFDVVISFARHSNISIDVAIDRMSDRVNMGRSENGIYEILGRWDEHIYSWQQAPGLSKHVMRYEDMVDNPKLAFKGLLRFLQVPIESKKLRIALDKSSFHELQKQENKHGFMEKPSGMEMFFRTGKQGGWVDVLTPAQVERVHVEFATTIDEFFPEAGEQASAFVSN